jgi:hypothetical protein
MYIAISFYMNDLKLKISDLQMGRSNMRRSHRFLYETYQY